MNIFENDVVSEKEFYENTVKSLLCLYRLFILVILLSDF
jgi:hypothetical protein